MAADLDVTDFLHVGLETAQLAERELDGGKALAELLVQFALQIRWLRVVDYTRLQATSNTAVTAAAENVPRPSPNFCHNFISIVTCEMKKHAVQVYVSIGIPCRT